MLIQKIFVVKHLTLTTDSGILIIETTKVSIMRFNSDSLNVNYATKMCIMKRFAYKILKLSGGVLNGNGVRAVYQVYAKRS